MFLDLSWTMFTQIFIPLRKVDYPSHRQLAHAHRHLFFISLDRGGFQLSTRILDTLESLILYLRNEITRCELRMKLQKWI